MDLSVLISDSPLGRLRLEACNNAITGINFINDEPVSGPDGYGIDTHPLLLECRNQLNDYFAGRLSAFNLAIRSEGSDFQIRIWNELLKIPYGKRISYLDLSKRIGDVKAIRAVGTANGKNRIAIIVPCHRVVGSDGTLTGYAGGLWRKQWLLEHEMKIKHGVRTLFQFAS